MSRIRSWRARRMARPLSDERRPLSQRRLPWILGWGAAAGLVLVLAVAVNLVGSPGAPPGEAPGTSPSPAGSPQPIAFGTAIDTVTGEVATDSTTDRFRAGDTFAYSVRPDTPPATSSIRVEVLRVGPGAAAEVVQAPSEQPIPEDAQVIAFRVRADDLIAAWGPGEYLMRIYVEPDAGPIAEAPFRLIEE